MKSHKTLHRVCFGDTDSQLIVYYGNYFRFFEIGRNEFFRELGLNVKSLESKIKPVVHNIVAKYSAPAKFDDLLELETTFSEIRTSSFKLDFQLKNHNSNELLNRTEIVYVFVDETGKKTNIPVNIRNALEK